MMIGFSDDSLAGIISNILTELSHWSFINIVYWVFLIIINLKIIIIIFLKQFRIIWNKQLDNQMENKVLEKQNQHLKIHRLQTNPLPKNSLRKKQQMWKLQSIKWMQSRKTILNVQELKSISLKYKNYHWSMCWDVSKGCTKIDFYSWLLILKEKYLDQETWSSMGLLYKFKGLGYLQSMPNWNMMGLKVST